MERKVLWNRPVTDRFDRVSCTSKCGRYRIVKRHYTLPTVSIGYNIYSVSTGKKLGEHDTLRDAKDEAEYDNDPNWEPN